MHKESKYESSPSVGQDGVNILHEKLCSSRFTVDCAVYDLFQQTDVLLLKKLLNNQRCITETATSLITWHRPKHNKHIKKLKY